MPTRVTAAAVLPSLARSSTSEVREHLDRLEAEVVVLFEQFRDPLLRYLSSFGLPVPDREEIIQEVFLFLFQHLRHGKSRENLPGWIFRVAHNLALKRRCRNRREFAGRSEPVPERVAIDPAPNPEEHLVHSRTRHLIEAVVESLPEQDRRCLFLRAEGLRYRQIGEVLDISLGAVSISIARSLARITRAMTR